ncbi:MAG: serine/threonine-protein kinase [Gemmatales bacterium]|nr:serine/threonine-protein kinase [Gemmatales bacterium]
MNESSARHEPERSQEGLDSLVRADGELATSPPTLTGKEDLPAERRETNQSQQSEEADWPGDDAPTIISKPAAAGSGSPQRSASAVTVRGRRLAHFELEEPIGVGGMAAVIRARDTQLDRWVALKILPPESASDPEQVKRFEQEARAAARLDHENIARVYYCGEDQGLHFIAFEYVEGENLRDRIARRGRIPIVEATQYVLQVARGLEHAADRGVVHRDIKPSNIVITAQGVAKLIDMGLARTQGGSAGELTHSGVTLGTFDYISPEQALDPRLADVRSDIYSLGCTFYHMLTGRPPTPEGTAARKLHFHQAERPVDPRYYNPEIPRELILILGRMLAKEPERRYQHPRELIADLELVLAQWKRQRNRVQPRDTLYRLSPQRYRGRWALVLAILALCTITVLSWLEAQRPSGETVPSPGLEANQVSVNDNSKSSLPPFAAGTDSQVPPAATPAVYHVKTPLELRRAFQEVEEAGKSAIVYLEETDYHLNNLPVSESSLLSLRAGQVVVEPRSPGPATLYFDLAAGEVPEARLSLLNLQGGIVTLRQVRLVMRLPPAGETITLLRLRSGLLLLESCEIVVESTSEHPGASVFQLAGTDPARCRVSLQQCVVRSAVPVFLCEGSAEVILEDCGLSTQAGLIVARTQRQTGSEAVGEGASESSQGEDKTRNLASLSWRHCTWWLERGPGIVVSSGSALRLHWHHCILARLRPERTSSLVELREEPLSTSPELTKHLDNCVVHRLEPVVARVVEGEAGEVLLSSLRTWRSNLLSLSESGCVSVEAPPWASQDPLLALEQARLLEAFRARADAVELRRRDQPEVVLGVRRLLGQSLYPSLPSQLVSLNRTPVRELIVDGVGGKPHTFDSLSSALNSAAAEGEGRVVITLRVHGALPIRSLLDIVGNRQITIRAAEGFRPELSFHSERVPESSNITSLFRVHDGQLVLEQIGFRLTPLATGSVRWQAVVNLTGSGSCTLRQCYVTFANEGDEPQLALVALTDPPGMMAPAGKPNRTAETPLVNLDTCFLRGRGVGLYVAESRPVRVQLQHTLAVLEAPLMRVETSRPDSSMLPTGEMVCHLERVSVCSTEPLIYLLATKENSQPVPVRWHAVSSLFVVQGTNEPALLRLEGPNTESEIRRTWLSWTGQADKPNVLSVEGSALVWRPVGQQRMMSAVAADRTEWSNFWGTNSEEVRFIRPWRWVGFQVGEKPTWQVEPQEFQIPPGQLPHQINEVGADLTRLPLYHTPSPEANPPSN